MRLGTGSSDGSGGGEAPLLSKKNCVALGLVAVLVVIGWYAYGVYRDLSGAALDEAAIAQRKAHTQQSRSPAAATGDTTAEQLMSYMDANGDGKITMDEAPEELKAGFAAVDRNGDGGIDVAEAQIMADYANKEQSGSPDSAPGEMTAETMMSYMDTDGDGKITVAEAPDEVKAAFTDIDTNGDGGIDVREAQVMADYANNQQR